MKAETISRFLPLLIIIGATLAIVSASSKMIRSPLAKGDMEAYLHAARLIVTGQDIYATPSRPVEMGGLYYIYPPLLAVLFIPLTFVPVPVAIVIWCVLNVLLLFWIIATFYESMTGTSLQNLKADARWIIIFFSLLPPSRFILHHLFYGQSNILILALTVLGLKQIHNARSMRGALSIGLSIAIKILAYPFAVWFLFRRNLKATASILACSIVGLLLPSFVLGFNRTWSYLVHWFRDIALYTDLLTAKVPLSVNISVQAQLYRFFGKGVGFTYNGQPYYLTLFQLPDNLLHSADRLVMIAMLGVIAAYSYAFRRSSDLVSYWGATALIFALMSVFTPFAQKHYLVLLLPPFIYIVHVWYGLGLRDASFRALVIGSFGLLFLTNEAICGEMLGGIFTGTGCMAWGALLVATAIFRAGTCLAANQKLELSHCSGGL